jgi:hypothetical protein
MPGMDDTLSQLTNKPSFLDWLRGNAEKRGVPSWKDTTAGREGGFPGREPGMPLAQGNSRMAGGRLGGTYAPSGNMPTVGGSGGVPPGYPTGSGIPGTGPWAGGSGIGSAARWFNPYLAATVSSPLNPYAASRDIGTPRHTQQEMLDWLKKRQTQGGSNGGASMPVPIPPASNTSSAQLIPPAKADGVSPTPAAGGPMPPPWGPQPTQPWPTAPSTAAVPLPTPRPQQASVPLPRPKPLDFDDVALFNSVRNKPSPSVAQQAVPVPRVRPQVPLPHNRPQIAALQPDRNSILAALLGRPVAYDHQAQNSAGY